MSHTPVLLQASITALNVKPNHWYIDATLGAGGHTKEIFKHGGNVLGIDSDVKAIDRVEEWLSPALKQTKFNVMFSFTTDNFSHLKEIAATNNLKSISGILFDLGYSSDQIENSKYGLSFQTDGPLDMRLDPNLGVTAADLINSLPESHLENLFTEFGDEPKAKIFAKLIVQQRQNQPFVSTQQLANLAIKIYGGRTKIAGRHPATQIFQAFRIAVNNEYDNLSSALPQAVELLEPGGRLAVISFHSGEDRIVKHFIQSQTQLKTITNKPIIPDQTEITTNPRSRSAKLRVAEKL